MNATITSSYSHRGRTIASNFTYPIFSQEIEKRLLIELQNAQREDFELTLKIAKNNP